MTANLFDFQKAIQARITYRRLASIGRSKRRKRNKILTVIRRIWRRLCA